MKQASYSINAEEERGNETFEISKDYFNPYPANVENKVNS